MQASKCLLFLLSSQFPLSIEKGFRLSIQKKFCMVGVMRHWNRLPREIRDAPSLEVLKARVVRALSKLVK